MLFESSRQAPLFSVFICLGIVLGAIYDIFYVFRLKRKGFFIHLSDILFSLVFFVFTAACTFLFNSGQLEIYFFFGIFLGFCAERASLGKFIKISIDFFAKILYNLYIRLEVKERFKRLLK